MIEQEVMWLRTALSAAQSELNELKRRSNRLAEAAETYLELAQTDRFPTLEQAVAWYRILDPKKV